MTLQHNINYLKNNPLMNVNLLPTSIARLLLAILMCLPAWSRHLSAQTAESYAVYDEANFTLTFKHDANKPAGAYALNEDTFYPEWFKDDGSENNANIIKKVVFDASFAEARPTNCSAWFSACDNLTAIEGIENLNTENVTNMCYMFFNCSALETLDLSSFDTQNVTDMFGMFAYCSALETLNLSNFDTQNVLDMGGMFLNCSALETLDVSKFDTQNVTDMDDMFDGCPALKTIYASDLFVTTAVVNGEAMFLGCVSLVGAVPYDENKIGKEMANYTTGYFTYKEPTGIDTPTVSDSTPAEYYDLQGRRLNAPQKGINIVKQGNMTTKMLVK